MSSSRDRSSSTARSFHRLVEHYTPDGTLGRALLGAPAILLAPFLFLGGIEILMNPTSLVSFLTGVFAFAFSLPTLFVGLATAWPVYLSLIGNVESPEKYPEAASKPGDDRESRNNPDTPEEVLKRRYAAGELTREEFERRLDEVMGSAGSESAEMASRRGESEADDDRIDFETSPSR
jgi:hypothetical protein